jgi:hypothetical protein
MAFAVDFGPLRFFLKKELGLEGVVRLFLWEQKWGGM